MKHDPIPVGDELARLKNELLCGNESPFQPITRWIGRHPVATVASALLAGMIVGIRPNVIRGVLGVGGWWIIRAIRPALSHREE